MEGVAYEEGVAGKRGDGYSSCRSWEERSEDMGGPGARGNDQTSAWYCCLCVLE